ncbi:putative NAD(P)H nitroreductase YdjA [Microbacterium sp. TNHR37B]|nr:putative NAD(P)H nitroreductase YdjA [Microbacterium sp. TNHR37B]
MTAGSPSETTERGALSAVRARRSWSKVTDAAPTRTELVSLVAAAGRVADHSALRPWRLIELRGADRERLGAAIATAQGDDRPSTKPLRAPLLIAVVASYRPSEKVPRWEQEAVASGVAHVLSLLLDEAGWGVIWRTGHYTRDRAVAEAHGLSADEELLGWLYVGGKPANARPGRRKPIDARALLTRMPVPLSPVDDPAGPDASNDTKPSEKEASKKSPGTTSAKTPKASGEKKTKNAKKARKKAKKAAKKAKKNAEASRAG